MPNRGNGTDKPRDKRSLSSATRFAANWRLLAATQLSVKDQKAGEIVFLDLAPQLYVMGG
jgi:hypothetical protein